MTELTNKEEEIQLEEGREMDYEKKEIKENEEPFDIEDVCSECGYRFDDCICHINPEETK